MHAAIIGAGVIGSGWAARFLLHGWDIRIYDPAPGAATKVTATIARAHQALNALYEHQLPQPGSVTFADEPADAVRDAAWVQESLPESLDMKQQFYLQAQPHLSPDTPLASSTSGFKPTALAKTTACSGQILVCHPFNPVYLLPAVEVVPGRETRNDITQRGIEILATLGMAPTVISTEIDAHVADRLLEAMWREALWLVKDGVATTEQIDNIMRNGFGLRWAQQGLFETYRIGGGEAGMRHFLEQFGPALAWPWSRLTDVPEMDEALIEQIAAQSDAQSGHMTIAELESQRDDNLVAILRALQQSDSGAGHVINAYLERASEPG